MFTAPNRWDWNVAQREAAKSGSCVYPPCRKFHGRQNSPYCSAAHSKRYRRLKVAKDPEGPTTTVHVCAEVDTTRSGLHVPCEAPATYYPGAPRPLCDAHREVCATEAETATELVTTDTQTCSECGASLHGRRAHAQVCSHACRMRRHRRRNREAADRLATESESADRLAAEHAEWVRRIEEAPTAPTTDPLEVSCPTPTTTPTPAAAKSAEPRSPDASAPPAPVGPLAGWPSATPASSESSPPMRDAEPVEVESFPTPEACRRKARALGLDRRRLTSSPLEPHWSPTHSDGRWYLTAEDAAAARPSSSSRTCGEASAATDRAAVTLPPMETGGPLVGPLADLYALAMA